MAEPISDADLAELEEEADGAGVVELSEPAFFALIDRLRAAEALAVPEGWKVEWGQP